MTLDELKATLDSFSPIKIEFVAKVMESLANPPSANIRSRGTWLTSEPDWIEYFGLALSVHHGTTTEPLGLTSFETVFRNACEQLRWSIDPPGSPTERFVDLVVRPQPGNCLRLSLKSSAAKNLSETTLHISKLTEAAWIQDVRTARDRRDRTLELFRQYQSAVTQIVMLRAFREDIDKIPHKYQLVEVPVSIFDSIQQAPLGVFERDAPVIECTVGDRVAAMVAIDRSDAKITIKKVQLSACTVHAEWDRA
ncbi:MAG: hypothetical protein OXC38_02490 [Gammaproteobacteria bacterium]|nr:hypothetical protein [Gammaproteobacteria bacterium]